MRVRLSSSAALAALALLTTACGDVSPTGVPGISVASPAASGPAASVSASASPAAGTARAERAARRAQFEALRYEWRAYKDSLRAGTVVAEFARCAPQRRAETTRTIGAGGGVIKVGAHTLTVPAGALAADVRITAVAPAGARRGVEFAPHGLQFAKPVRLTISYDQCVVPVGAEPEVVYTGTNDTVIARQPSLDAQDARQVEAWTDHFSGYLVAYGRR